MKQFSIRQYVVWLTLVPLFIIVASLELFFLRHHFSQMDQSMLEKGELLAHQLAAGSEYGVFSNNMNFLRDIANSALQQSDIRGVAIFDVDTRMLAVAGEFSSAFKSEIIERKAANRLQFAHTGDIDEAIVLHPATNGVSDLWLYHAIIPTQIAFDDFGSKTTIKPTCSVILEISWDRHERHKTQMLWVT